MENEIQDFVELPVTGGYVTKVDPDIAEKLKGKKIFLMTIAKKYPAIWLNKKNVRIHRYIKNPTKYECVDHINGDTFDNRRSNLRICSISINNVNLHTTVKSNSGFRGVSFYKKSRKYLADFCFNKKKYYIGYYRNPYIASILKDICVQKVVKVKVSYNFNHSLPESKIPDFIEKSKGKIFKLCFAKRTDGSFREMVCRSGVKKHINGKGMAFAPSNNNLVVVFDMQNKSYKCVPLENIICLKFERKNYLVTRKRLVA